MTVTVLQSSQACVTSHYKSFVRTLARSLSPVQFCSKVVFFDISNLSRWLFSLYSSLSYYPTPVMVSTVERAHPVCAQLLQEECLQRATWVRKTGGHLSQSYTGKISIWRLSSRLLSTVHGRPDCHNIGKWWNFKVSTVFVLLALCHVLWRFPSPHVLK
jgi:hypothetical protein